jgi:toxoflavin synthase
MTTNYDPIAEQYKRSKQQPWRTHIEAFTLMRLIGDPTSKAVVDIACGEGSGRCASGARRKSPASTYLRR